MGEINEKGVNQVTETIIKAKPGVSPAIAAADPSADADQSTMNQGEDPAAGQDPSKPLPWWHDKKDKYGRRFNPSADPQIHVTNKQNEPVIGKKYGTIKIRPGMAKKGAAKPRPGFKDVPDQEGPPAGSADQGPPDPAADQDQPAGAFFTKEMAAELAAGMVFQAYGLLGKDAAKPLAFGTTDELEVWKLVLAAKFDESGTPELTTNQTMMCLVAIGILGRAKGNPGIQDKMRILAAGAWGKVAGLGRWAWSKIARR